MNGIRRIQMNHAVERQEKPWYRRKFPDTKLRKRSCGRKVKISRLLRLNNLLSITLTCILFSSSICPPIAPYGYRYGHDQSRIRNCSLCRKSDKYRSNNHHFSPGLHLQSNSLPSYYFWFFYLTGWFFCHDDVWSCCWPQLFL